MNGKIARRKVAAYAAEQLSEGADVARLSQQLVAYLVDTRQVAMSELLIRDIEGALLDRGVAVAHITSAHPVDNATRESVSDFIKAFEHAKQVVIASESVDPALIGGVQIRSSQRVFDGSVRTQLKQLRASAKA